MSHYLREKYIPMEDDQRLEADQLPPGRLPLWLDVPNCHVTRRDVLEKISMLEDISGLSVTVVGDEGDSCAQQFCKERNWKLR